MNARKNHSIGSWPLARRGGSVCLGRCIHHCGQVEGMLWKITRLTEVFNSSIKFTTRAQG
jgi:hypothetical protein